MKKYIGTKLIEGLGLATERIEIACRVFRQATPSRLGLATERIEMILNIRYLADREQVSVLRPSGLKYCKLFDAGDSDGSRSCDRAD